MYIAIILFSFFVSLFASVRVMDKGINKWLAMLFALCMNALILITATWILYINNEEARLFGFGHTNLYLLIFAIPFITWLNFLFLEVIRKIKISS